MTELIDPPKRVRGIFYGWWMVGVSALVMAVATVPLFQGMAAWFPVLETRFGWSRAQLSWAFSLTRVEGSITGPLTGYLIERLGPRWMVLIGLPIMGTGFILLSRVQELWHLYVAFIVMSIGSALGTWLPMMTVVNNWFIRRRAMAMAVSMEGYALGGVALVPVLAWSINPVQFGPDRWRDISFGIGVAIILMALPICLLVRNRPEEYGQLPDGDKPAPVPAARDQGGVPLSSPDEPSFTWQQAVRTRTFWLITAGHTGSSIVVVTLMVHLGSMLNIDRGFSLPTVGLVVGAYTGVAALTIPIAGYMGDRMPIRTAIFGFTLIQSVSVVVLLFAHSLPMAFLASVLLGIGFGGRSPLTTAIRGVYFGRKSFASITGISQMPMNVLLFVMPIYAGYMRDATGNYDIAFGTVAAISFLGAICFLPLGEPPCLSRPQRPAPAVVRRRTDPAE